MSRNIKSTKEEIFKLVESMMKHDLRFGQIVSNVFDKVAKDGTDPFFVTDEKFLKHLTDYVNS
jgi:hypothetical protein